MEERPAEVMINQLRQQLAQSGDIVLSVKVRPNASKTQIKDQMDDGTWKIDVAAVPEDGKANAELVAFLAEEFGVPRGNVEIVSGQTAARKQVRIVNNR